MRATIAIIAASGRILKQKLLLIAFLRETYGESGASLTSFIDVFSDPPGLLVLRDSLQISLLKLSELTAIPLEIIRKQ